ncbi:MAG TPA: amylo-alpha-1,6-glucosidase [Actinomycetes bacterium]|nr:amylo-alpha-1,6-glucosidase [Actinomycetes bacterium]
MPDKLTSPAGEEFMLADASVNRVLVKGVVAVMHARTERLWSTKEGDMFLCADAEGNLDAEKAIGAGFYWRDTRYLSDFMLQVDGHAPLLLSTSADRVFASHVDLANQDLVEEDGTIAAVQGTVNIRRTRVIDGRLHERIRVKNYNAAAVDLTVRLTFGTDFADIFEVRGLKRATRGKMARPKAGRQSAAFAYAGEDGVFRETRIAFELEPTEVMVDDEQVVAEWRLRLQPTQTEMIALTVEPRAASSPNPPERSFDVVMHDLRRSYESWERSCTRIWTDNELYNSLLSRGMRDLRALLTPTRHGNLVAAGIPWFVAPFGRDALLTCHQTLMLNPDLTRATLEVLAAFQADEVDEWRDAQPGKILHELRQGELAGAGVIPHTPYYGSIDSTPLWLLLLGTYYRWTGDLEFCRKLLPNVERALAWIADYGDRDGDGFLEYQRSSPRGLVNQGWKDSHDSIGHVDGKLAEGPIALAEVQGYVYMAKLRMAEVFEALGNAPRAATLRGEAASLRAAFNEHFWVESEQFFAMALDGDKRQVAAISSNPAHGLYCGIVDQEKAGPMARRLLAPDMFSGWGVRTLSKSAAAYNPMSYHNGSIWPHDNAIIGAGLKRYGFAKATNRLATAMFEMAVTVDDMRLPELFCGFTRRSPNRPVAYPVACSPQAWAAGAPFLLLQAMLGISANAPANTINVNKPHLPGWLNTVELHDLRVGSSTVSVVFQRQGEMTGFSLLGKDGDVRVLMEE